ncbi:YdeI/OmpD-associated family protein [Lewinella sp. IMCC34183]|uniref:YdeI/OmpD-associated family protein n=1 Tax=Lewinella sp. IMCC34183 TaxID=2248762 RepID=UPI0018E51859|nr:YdeI/OmpD-associated family protein [Lewinella sp. IMCC34183]
MTTLTVPLTEAEQGTSYAGVYHTVFLIPRTAVAELLEREHNATRIICRINGAGEVHGGLMNDGRGDFFLTVSKEVRKQFGLDVGDQVTLELRPDDSDYGMAVPAEVTELWDLDPEARAVFHQLTPGHQRNLLYQIDKLKRPDSRAKKCVQIHDYLKHVNGKLDYRELNAWIKADNR